MKQATNQEAALPANRVAEEARWWEAQQMRVTRENLRTRIESMRKDLDHALLQLDEGFLPNPLGICQRQAQDIDRLCAQLDSENKTLAMLQHLAKEVGEAPAPTTETTPADEGIAAARNDAAMARIRMAAVRGNKRRRK